MVVLETPLEGAAVVADDLPILVFGGIKLVETEDEATALVPDDFLGFCVEALGLKCPLNTGSVSPINS